MTLALQPTQDAVQTAVVNFIAAVVPGGVVVEGQDNRVAQPSGDFVEITSWRRKRLATNIDRYRDCQFTGSIIGETMTVSAIAFGSINVGATVYGAASGTVVTSAPSGGGPGAYGVSVSQTLSQTTLAAGQVDLVQETELTYVVAANGDTSPDVLQALTTAWRDIWATDFFADSDPAKGGAVAGMVSPLYCEDPQQRPFLDENQQVENRWAVEMRMQVDPALTFPQQFAAEIDATVEPPVDAQTP